MISLIYKFFNIILIFICLAYIYRGYINGCIIELFSISIFIFSLFLSLYLHNFTFSILNKVFSIFFSDIISLLMIFFLSFSALSLLKFFILAFLKSHKYSAGFLSKIIGGFFGLIKFIIVTSLIVFVAYNTLYRDLIPPLNKNFNNLYYVTNKFLFQNTKIEKFPFERYISN